MQDDAEQDREEERQQDALLIARIVKDNEYAPRNIALRLIENCYV